MHIETSTHKVSTDETVPSTIITPEQLYDPLLVLFNKLHLNYCWALTGMAILSRWWVGVALFLLTMYWLYRFFFVPNDPLKHAPLWLLFIVIFVFSLVGYVGFLSIVWLLRIVVFTNRLFQNFAIRVRPLHPDGSGGLGLFNYFLWISVTLMMIGVCSAISLRLHGFNVTYLLAAIACYLIILPSLLTRWLTCLHPL